MLLFNCLLRDKLKVQPPFSSFFLGGGGVKEHLQLDKDSAEGASMDNCKETSYTEQPFQQEERGLLTEPSSCYESWKNLPFSYISCIFSRT
jgi:hypothetical protein